MQRTVLSNKQERSSDLISLAWKIATLTIRGLKDKEHIGSKIKVKFYFSTTDTQMLLIKEAEVVSRKIPRIIGNKKRKSEVNFFLGVNWLM
jgi:hypothetical protein